MATWNAEQWIALATLGDNAEPYRLPTDTDETDDEHNPLGLE